MACQIINVGFYFRCKPVSGGSMSPAITAFKLYQFNSSDSSQ